MKNNKLTIISLILIAALSIVMVSLFYSGIYCDMNNMTPKTCPAKNLVYNGKPLFDWRGITTNFIHSNSEHLRNDLIIFVGYSILGFGMMFFFNKLIQRNKIKHLNKKNQVLQFYPLGYLLTLIISILDVPYLSEIIINLFHIKSLSGYMDGFSGVSIATMIYSSIFVIEIFIFLLERFQNNEKLKIVISSTLFIFSFIVSISIITSLQGKHINWLGHIIGAIDGLIIGFIPIFSLIKRKTKSLTIPT